MTTVWNWVKARLAEPSTWAGVAVAAMAVSNGLATHADIGGLVGGVLAALLSEKSS